MFISMIIYNSKEVEMTLAVCGGARGETAELGSEPQEELSAAWACPLGLHLAPEQPMHRRDLCPTSELSSTAMLEKARQSPPPASLSHVL